MALAAQATMKSENADLYESALAKDPLILWLYTYLSPSASWHGRVWPGVHVHSCTFISCCQKSFWDTFELQQELDETLGQDSMKSPLLHMFLSLHQVQLS